MTGCYMTKRVDEITETDNYYLAYGFKGWLINRKEDHSTAFQFGQSYDGDDGRGGAIAVLANLNLGIEYDFDPTDDKHLFDLEGPDSIDAGDV